VQRLYKFLALPWRGKLLHLNTAFWLLVVKAGLYLVAFERLRGWLDCFDGPAGKPVETEEMGAIVEAIERMSRVLAPFRINCLPQALVGHKLLREKGFDVQLKIGVQKDRRHQLAAHAWLEYQGRVVLGDLRGLARFAAFPNLRAARR
jgi:hypothetical protein